MILASLARDRFCRYSMTMKWLNYVCGTLVVLCLNCALAGQETVGRIEVIGPNSIDFGKYPARERKVARYKIRNAGEGILKILKVRKTCGCSSARTDKTELKPEEEATIEVTMLPNAIAGLYSKNTYVESTDPNNRFLRLTVAGNAIPLVEIRPKNNVYAGRIPTGNTWSQSFDLNGTDPYVRLGKITKDSNYAVETVFEQIGGKESSQYRLSVTLLPTTKSGDFKCSVKIPVLMPKNQPPLKISVSGKIGAELNALPGIIRLPVSDNPVERRFNLRVIGQRSRVLDPKSLKVPENKEIEFDVKQARDGRGLVVSATFSSRIHKDPFR